jgi:hypothetical protein
MDVSAVAPRAASRDQQGSGGAAQPRWHAVVALVLVVLALAPVLVVIVLRTGHAYTPAGDIGAIDLRVREVWSWHPPLVGPYGNHGWDHPGPLLFYLLSLPSLLAGHAAWGTQVGGALLQGVAIVWLAALAWRRGGLALLATVMVGVSLLANTMSPELVRDPWNPHVALPFFVLLLFQTWLLATGDAKQLPWAVGVATFVVQSHVVYLPLVVAMAAVVVVCRLVDRRHARGDAPAERAARTWRRAAGWSLLVGFVLWLPPLIDALSDWPGNLGDIATYFLHPDRSIQAHVGFAEGARLLAAEFAPTPDWLRGTSGIGFALFPQGQSAAWFVLPVALLTVGIVVARRRGEVATVRFLSLVSVLGVAGCLALSRVEGQPLLYLFFWRPIIAIALVLGVGWSLLAGTGLVRRYAPVAGSVLAVLILVWGSGQYAVDVARASDHDSPTELATASLARQLRRQGIPRGGVILRLDEKSLLQLQRGVLDELSRHSDDVFVDQSQAYQYRSGLAADPASVGRVWWVAEYGAALAELMAHPGARLVASWSSLDASSERRARALASELRAQFHAVHRPDLDAALDGQFLELLTEKVDGVDHEAARELTALNLRVLRDGGIRAGVVEFAPEEAPPRLEVSGG